jgi:hypothetical protein
MPQKPVEAATHPFWHIPSDVLFMHPKMFIIYTAEYHADITSFCQVSDGQVLKFLYGLILLYAFCW